MLRAGAVRMPRCSWGAAFPRRAGAPPVAVSRSSILIWTRSSIAIWKASPACTTGPTFRRLLDAVAATTGSTLNLNDFARDLGIAANTVRAYVDLLKTLFLVYRLPAWHSNLLSRLVKAPKLHIVDSGLLAYLLSANAERVWADPQIAGALIETFVVMEIVRLASADPDPPRAFHLRDRQGHEVDMVLERRDGTIVGIEAKAAATAGRADFHGLRLMRERLGERFAFGALLYTGPATVPFGDRLAAIPLQGLWTGA